MERKGTSIPIKSTAVHTGRNRDISTWDDDRYVTCSNCGFICHLDRDVRAQRPSRVGDGITHTDIGITPDDPTVSMGCPFCGKLDYDM